MATNKLQPIAFMSYVHSDDKYGHLTQFRERLSDEVQVQIGVEFPIFQDRKDIRWGQSWKQRIDDSIDEVTFFIPIITPSFFNSSPCRDELQQFLEREIKLNRSDLVLPLYYVTCPLLHDDEKRATDPLAQAIADHQWADWRELRFEPFTSPQVGRALAELAVQIREALEASNFTTVHADSALTSQVLEGNWGSGKTSLLERAQRAEIHMPRIPGAKTEPPTRVVDLMHRGDHASIAEAIEAANPGDRILLRPGLYQEGIVMDKPLEILGDGELDDVIVQPFEGSALAFRTTMGRVANLTFRQASDDPTQCVSIGQGRLELERCDISATFACINIRDGADPRIRDNNIHGAVVGVSVSHNGLGTIESNYIFGNKLAGVVVSDGGRPTVRNNRISHTEYEAIWIQLKGGGTFTDNDLRGNKRGPWDIADGSLKYVKRSGNIEDEPADDKDA